MFRSKLFVGSLVAATTLSAFILSSTTVNAETYTKSALIRVSSACTMSGAVATAHTATVNGGTYTPDIGESVLTTVCNDSGGFAVYAIGFTNEMDGNNTLENSTNSNITIATGTATSGQTSNWAMKLTPHQNGDNTPTIENGYSNYSIVPSDYVKVASYPSATAESASVSFKTYYAVYVSHQQTSGTYNGKVKYVMVHPSNGEAPEKDPDPLTTTFDEAFGNAGKTKVTVNNQQYYKEQDMTSFICDSITEGQTTELVDIRDNTIYRVGKLADGNCWMLDNLALDLTDSTVQSNINTSNTNADQASLTSLFYGNRDNGAQYANGGVSIWPSGVLYSYSVPLIISVGKDLTNTNDSVAAASSWKYGILYNYCAASAGNFCYGDGTDHMPTSSGTVMNKPNTAIDTEYDICPSNWRLPTGYNYDSTDRTDGGEFQAIATLVTGKTEVFYNDFTPYAAFREALRLPLAGSGYNKSTSNRGTIASFWSSTYSTTGSMYTLTLSNNGASTYDTANKYRVDPQWDISRYFGRSIRCIAK